MPSFNSSRIGNFAMQQIPQQTLPSSLQQVQQFPTEVYQQAAMYQLGTPTAFYQPSLTNPVAIMGLTIGVIVVDVVLAIVILGLGWIVSLLIAIPILMIVYCIRALTAYNLRVYLFQNGFVYSKGSQSEVIRWDQVRTVWQRVLSSRYGRVSYRYTIERLDGTTFRVDTMLKNASMLGQNIQQEVTRVHMPQAIAAYNAGNALPFGPFSVNLQGFRKGNEVLPWNQVQGLLFKKGNILVKVVGSSRNGASARISSIPNCLVFIKLVDYARSQGGTMQC
jgi:hypothetical protein